jgi:3',5'-nucleoside bisphosphate phosphatase
VLAPERVVHRATLLGLTALSLCDHDTVAGQHAARSTARSLGLSYLTGIEISCHLHVSADNEKEVHLLGYGFNPDADAISQYVRARTQSRHDRVRQMCAQLGAVGVQLDAEALLTTRTGEHIGRPHVAQALVSAGYVPSTKAAFDTYIGRGKPGYVPYDLFIRVPAAIALIHAAGGLAVLAHPGEYGADVSLAVMTELVAAGLDGIEIVHPRNDSATMLGWAAFARGHALSMTGGSDWHGTHSSHAGQLGVFGMSVAAYRQLRERLHTPASAPP